VVACEQLLLLEFRCSIHTARLPPGQPAL